LEEPENTVIVHGTLDDEAGNREAATLLAERIRVHWSNLSVPVIADRDATDEKLKGKHLLLVGRPSTNSVSARFAKSVPVTFTPGTFTGKGKLHAHADSAVAAAGTSPLDGRYSVVIVAGLNAASTYHAASNLLGKKEQWPKEVPAGEAWLLPA